MPPKLHTGFLSHDRQERHSELLPYTDRFLDSMAGILETVEPCAAVAYNSVDRKFLLSHNRDLRPDEELVIRKKQELLNNTVPNKEMILGIYLMYSYSFGKVLENYRDKFTEVSTRNASILVKLIDKIVCIRDKFNKYVIESNASEIRAKKAADDIKKIKLASDINSLQAWKKQADEYLQVATQDIEGIIDFIEHRDQHIKAVAQQYMEFLESGELTSLHINLIRPLQDVEKVLYHIACKRTRDTEYSIKIEVLQNPKKLHSEVNIASEFPNLAQKYIGVSILCCGACHEVLNAYEYAHRGTHGICNDWVSPALQFAGLVQSLYSKPSTDVASEAESEGMLSGLFGESSLVDESAESGEEALHERLHNRGRSLSRDEFEINLESLSSIKSHIMGSDKQDVD